MTGCRRCLAEKEDLALNRVTNFPLPASSVAVSARMVTADERHQVMCSNCKFKFAYRHRDACPRCKTTIEKMIDPLFLHYTYYHCSKSRRPLCPQKGVTGKELENQISERLAWITISKKFKDWAVKHLHELHEQEKSLQDEIIKAQQGADRKSVV